MIAPVVLFTVATLSLFPVYVIPALSYVALALTDRPSSPNFTPYVAEPNVTVFAALFTVTLNCRFCAA